MTTTYFVIERLDQPVREGTVILRWEVRGPGGVERFASKRDALLWARLRKQHASYEEAVRAFVNHQH